MSLEILRGPKGSACTLTTGGTESNVHAVKTVRDWARDQRPDCGVPEIVVPHTAHPWFNKAAAYMALKVMRVPQGDDLRADVRAMSYAINDNTVPIRLMQTPTTCRVRRLKILGNQGLMKL